MLSFALRRLTNPTSRERLARRLADAERLSAKRLRLITAQLQEIERLSSMNARLAALLLDHYNCSKSVDGRAILDLLIHPDPRMHGAATGEMSTIELPLSTPGKMLTVSGSTTNAHPSGGVVDRPSAVEQAFSVFWSRVR
jgi:hypothetical protein